MPKISIIINNYNYESYVYRCISSAIDQNYSDYEVIIVDDGSQDSSCKIIDQFADRATIIKKTNGGQASAINAGFAASSGSIIIFLDSDDFLQPNIISSIPYLFNEGVACVQFLMNVVDADGATIGVLDNRVRSSSSYSDELISDGPGNIKFPPTSGNAWSRKCLEAVMPIKEVDFKISADAYLFTMIPLEGKIVSSETVLSNYRIHHNNNYKSSFNIEKALRNYNIYMSRIRMLSQKINSQTYEDRWIVSTLYYYSLHVYKNPGKHKIILTVISSNLSLRKKLLRITVHFLLNLHIYVLTKFILRKLHDKFN